MHALENRWRTLHGYERDESEQEKGRFGDSIILIVHDSKSVTPREFVHILTAASSPEASGAGKMFGESMPNARSRGVLLRAICRQLPAVVLWRLALMLCLVTA